MVRIKKLESIQIEGYTKEEVQESIDKYISQGYETDGEICFSKLIPKFPYFAYIKKDDFDN